MDRDIRAPGSKGACRGRGSDRMEEGGQAGEMLVRQDLEDVMTRHQG